MTLFGALHISLLVAIVVVAAGLVVLCRSGRLQPRRLCIVLGCALALNELIWWIWRYSREGIHVNNLPFQLCDIAVWFAVAACLSRAMPIVEFTWFAGIAGAGMALLTPDLAAPWPQWPAIYFFLAHGGVVVAAVLMAFSGVIDFHPRSIWRAYAMLLAWAGVVGSVDWLSGANYMYLRQKPVHGSALDVMGPWPWYIVVGMLVAAAIFWLLWLPVRPLTPDYFFCSRVFALEIRRNRLRSVCRRPCREQR